MTKYPNENLKILLLNPPLNFGVYNQSGKIYFDRSYPPLGLAYIASVLEKAGYSVKLFDFMETNFEYIERIIELENPQIVGIACNLSDYRWGSFRVAQIIKRVNPKIKIIMGGCHATNMYKQILDNFPVDAVVRFEGELTFLELVKAFESGSELKNVNGIAYKNGKNVVATGDKSPITDLDLIPFPAYHFYNFEMYTNYPSELWFKGKNVGKMKKINMITSRGCPHNCQYCSVTAFWRRKFRTRGIKNIVDEMQFLKAQYGIEYFDFFDSVFTQNKDRVIDLCKEIINKRLDVCWGCVTKVDLVSADLLKWMSKAGCIRISYGVESGSELVLKAVKKRQTKSQIIRAFNLTHEAGISANILLMIGNPNETAQSIDETIEIINTVKPDKIRTNLTAIYPGTELYKFCEQMGYVDDEYWLTQKGAPIYVFEHGVKQLQKWENKILFSYYLQRKQLFQLVKIILYRKLFSNFGEMMRSAGLMTERMLEKIDQLFHSM